MNLLSVLYKPGTRALLRNPSNINQAARTLLWQRTANAVGAFFGLCTFATLFQHHRRLSSSEE
jgi:hypothetical protein